MTEKKKSVKKNIIAKKDFLIVYNDERYDIREGDDIEALKIPSKFYDNLKTEKVI